MLMCKAVILFALIIATVLLIAGCGGIDQAKVEREIAHACDPMKNVGVDYQGPSWELNGRYEITCEDGSQRIVLP